MSTSSPKHGRSILIQCFGGALRQCDGVAMEGATARDPFGVGNDRGPVFRHCRRTTAGRSDCAGDEHKSRLQVDDLHDR